MTSGPMRVAYDLKGVVQGVGFRPSVYRLARRAGLAGSIQNRAGTVRLILAGDSIRIENFMQSLPMALPSSARLESVTEVERSDLLQSDQAPLFRILDSSGQDETDVVIPADLAVCRHCLRDVLSRGNRRYGYPFTTCTDCGPRYTLVTAMPYDRERTTMSVFPMCPACRTEYESASDRRFHAETIACPACGPQLTLLDATGKTVPGDALRTAQRELSRGSIVAVRGVGGFLLAADAFNRDTLMALRERKRRPHKPFAVMAADIETLRRYCEVPNAAADLLTSSVAPIVILDLLSDAAKRLPVDLIAPDTLTLGAMLPTSPLHRLLLEPLDGDPLPRFDLLIMTSGNRRGEPICLTNDEARERLQGIADFFLLHNREINLRSDDSLCVIQHGAPQVWRRARGYAPNPVLLTQPLRRCVLAMGADLKNTVACAYGNRVVISPHVGDLDTPEAIDGFRQVTTSLPVFLNRMPDAIAVDLHPDMHSSRLGREIAAQSGVPVVAVQHHHAHALACLSEHGRSEGLALVFDGTGLGTDGTFWGAELVHVTGDTFRRLATFAGVPLPGGDAAIMRPARQLVGRWVDAGIPIQPEWLERLRITPDEADVWTQQCRKGVNAPITHGAGRLFDSFSALLGFAPDHATYEGQSAIRLEAAARQSDDEDACVLHDSCRVFARRRPSEETARRQAAALQTHVGPSLAEGRPRKGSTRRAMPEIPFREAERDGLLILDWSEAFRLLADPRATERDRPGWAMALHRAVARAALRMIDYGLSLGQSDCVALSGGVFMNRLLNELVIPEVERRGCSALIHRQTPPNDGCIALGQAVAAGSMCKVIGNR